MHHLVFQAEDGIRGLVRSRRLGYVYKKQQVNDALSGIAALNQQLRGANSGTSGAGGLMDEMTRRLDALGEQMDFQTRWEADGTLTSGSYKHLTLPTI